MSAAQTYIATPKSPQIRVSAANVNRDGTGTIVDLYTAGALGGRLDDIRIKANGTTTAGMVRFFKHDGVSYRIFTEVPVSAITPSGTVAAFESLLNDQAWVLAATHKIAVSTHNAEQFEIHVTKGGDF